MIGAPLVFKRDTAYMEVPRCDRCRYWLRDSNGAQAYQENRSICTMNGADRGGFACGASMSLTTDADFGCVRFEARV